MNQKQRYGLICAASAMLLVWPSLSVAHDVAQDDRLFVAATQGPRIVPFMYLGAKHMVTGYDHILFLIGVVMYLNRLRDVVLYVSIFTIGHSLTLMTGVLFQTGANSQIVDAIIGLSIFYKGADNLGWLRTLGWEVDTKLAILVFGLCHGLGLATKLVDLSISDRGLVPNLMSFNFGVELGQILVLIFIVSMMGHLRSRPSFASGAIVANGLLMVAGTIIMIQQLIGYLAT